MSLALFAAVVFAPQAQPSVAQPSVAPLTAQGRVVDVLGDPVPAAVVWVTDAAGRECARTASDGSGVFLLRGLPPIQRLRLHANGSGRVEYTVALPSAQSFRATILLEDAGPLRGVVLDAARAPVAGAHVAAVAPTLAYQGGDRWCADAVADAQGAFTFPDAPLRPCAVRAWAPGFDLSDAMCAPPDQPLAIELRKGAPQPRVVRVDGLPPGGAAVVTVDPGRGDMLCLPAPLREVAVRPDGTALLWPLTVQHMLGVRAAGFSVRPAAIPAAPGAADGCTFTLTPLPAALVNARTAIRAEVVDAMGQPLRGVEVMAAPLEGVPSGSATSDAAGAVALTVPVRRGVLCRLALAPGPFRIGDPHASFGEDGVTWLDVAADPDRVVKLHTLRASSITGDAGASFVPVEVAEMIKLQKAVQLARRMTSTTDETGRFDLRGLPGGSYRVIVHVSGQLKATVDVELKEGTAVTLDKLDVPPAGVVTGTVTDANGKPAAGVWVYPEPAQGRPGMPPGILQLMGVEPRSALTDRNGRYRMPRVAPGDYRLQILEQKPRPPVLVTVEAGRTATGDLTTTQ
jgi:protocatechuate 3,4-dioxygenase beta subunit